MKTKSLAAVVIAGWTFCSGLRAAPIVAYDSSAGGLYNPVGPVDPSPKFIGSRFAAAASGWLDTIALPLDNFATYAGPVASGTLTLWSDKAGVVGTPLFSASVSATYFPPSNTVLPPFTVISANPQAPVLLNAGSFYWLTLSETDGTNGLIFFSNVNLASAGTVYFGANTVPQYAQGLQVMVMKIDLNPVPEPSSGLFLSVGLGILGARRRWGRSRGHRAQRAGRWPQSQTSSWP